MAVARSSRPRPSLAFRACHATVSRVAAAPRRRWSQHLGEKGAKMRPLLMAIMLGIAVPAHADDNIVHDDGVGAQISYRLPRDDVRDGQAVQYTTLRIAAVKDGKFLLLVDLAGSKSEDGKSFSGKVIIPSELIASAEFLMLGSLRNSSRGAEKKTKISTFKRVVRAKSWTDQE